MNHGRLLVELDEVGGRYRRLYSWAALAVGCLLAAAIAAGILVAGWDTTWFARWAVLTLAVIALTASAVGALLLVRRTRDLRWIARRIEATHPELETLLLAAVEQKPNLPDGRFGFLQQTVFRDA